MTGLALDALAAGRIAAAALLGGAAGGGGARDAGPGGALRGGAAAALLGRDAAAAQLVLAACEVAGPESEVRHAASAPFPLGQPWCILGALRAAGRGQEARAVLCARLQQLFLERPAAARLVHQQARTLFQKRQARTPAVPVSKRQRAGAGI